MHIRKTTLRIILALVLLTGPGSGVYFAYQNYQAAQALAENIEYQVLTAIEAQHPEIYIVAVQNDSGHVFVYFIPPAVEMEEGYGEALVIDIVAILYDAYPAAEAYHILPTEVIAVETFESEGYVGLAEVAFGFTNFAAVVMSTGECSPCVMSELLLAGESARYSAREAGINVITTATGRAKGHIPPWRTVEE